MKSKALALFLAAGMIFACLSGCASGAKEGSEETATPAPTEAAASHDFESVYAQYEPDTVVLTVNGSAVTWAEYFYWLYYNISYYEQYVGAITDFTAVSSFDETQTYDQFFKDAVVDLSVQYHALEVNAMAAGAVLDDEDEQYLQELLAADIISCCGEEGTEEDFYAYLETMYVSPELYNYINSVACLYNNGFDEIYAADGSEMTDEEVDAFIQANGYMTAKHILISTLDDEGAAIPDEEKAEKLALAEEIAAQLAAASDKDSKLALFEELMTQYNEDDSEAYYPGGYCFATGEMVEEFENAAAALGEYEASGVVESDYGYHIILRLPTTPDDIVEYYSEDEQYDLRYLAAVDAYDVLIGNWMADADIVWEPDFEDMNVSALFADA